jgi:hypothetical protein
MPFHLYRRLLAGFGGHWARFAVRMMRERRDGERRLILAGVFGDVFAWVWEFDRDEAMLMLSDTLSSLRQCQDDPPYAPDEDEEPPITLDELLRAVALALPADFRTRHCRDIRRMAERELPELPDLH